MNPAQIKLLRHLLEAIAADPVESERRWPNASKFATEYAHSQQLLLACDWTADFVLNTEGDVEVVDTEDGGPNKAATEDERRVALFRAIARYPQLVSMLPQRPATAITCEVCEGSGVPEVVWTQPSFRSIVCSCGGAGWTLHGRPVV